MTSPKKSLEEILRGIDTQVLETKYVINLGQLLRIVLNINKYIFKLVKSIQSMQPELAYAIMAIDH
jgi:hypothetical protein